MAKPVPKVGQEWKSAWRRVRIMADLPDRWVEARGVMRDGTLGHRLQIPHVFLQEHFALVKEAPDAQP